MIWARYRDMNAKLLRSLGATVAMITVLGACQTTAQRGGGSHPSLEGTWTLVAADREKPDGTRTHSYGETPHGRMMVDSRGRYSIQIFAAERPNYASGDGSTATESELRAVVQGTSTNYGQITVDWDTHTLVTTLEESSHPNSRGAVQNRRFELNGNVLTYRVPRPAADGSVPISVWRRDE
jgi:hypothetical protein